MSDIEARLRKMAELLDSEEAEDVDALDADVVSGILHSLLHGQTPESIFASLAGDEEHEPDGDRDTYLHNSQKGNRW